MSTLIISDLRDPAPPIPGLAQRAAVAGRARQLQHHRRLAQLGGVAAVAAMLVAGVAVVAATNTETSHRAVVAPASVRGTTANAPTATLVVTFTAADGTKYVVNAQSSGAFQLNDLPPGHYDVSWAYEQEGVNSAPNVDIGSATAVGRMTVDLSSGLNTVRIPIPQ